jgi:hypothetical protein
MERLIVALAQSLKALEQISAPGHLIWKNTPTPEVIPLSEIDMRPRPIDKTDQEPENAPDLTTTAPSVTGETDPLSMEADPPPAPEQQWNSATEEEWNEHSATAWALAYVIHRIRSTPHPPILLSEQRDHFHKVIEMAAALIEEWQRRERDQAQQLAQTRPIDKLSQEALEAVPDSLDENAAAEVWNRRLFTPPYQLLLADDEEDTFADTPKVPEVPAADDDYQI